MRIAFHPQADCNNGYYRCIGPMLALGDRGHEGKQLHDPDPRGLNREALVWCDVLHVHRNCDDFTLEHMRAAKAAGAAVVWDDDDDLTTVPRSNPGWRKFGGLNGRERLLARARIFRLADLVTTPSPVLAERFAEPGASNVAVVENQVPDAFAAARPTAHRGVVVGWVAGLEHHLDAERVPVVGALQRLLDRHPEARVVSVGLRLDLDSDRYEHNPGVPLLELPAVISGFDVGIAPLADIAFSRARSNVKLKEYAAVGVPWLASPTGPYEDLGEEQGGELVPDDGWDDALERAVTSSRWRRRHAKRAQRWGRRQTMGAHGGAWEAMLRDAIQGRTARYALNPHSRMGE